MAVDDIQKAVRQAKRAAFLAMSRLPTPWLRTAYRHKRAADILYGIAEAAAETYTRQWQENLTNPTPASGSGETDCNSLEAHFNMELISEYFLLIGYALECVFKGYLLAILPELVENEQRLDRLIMTHNLSDLCKDCGLTVSDSEAALLQYMTPHILWGKYPCPGKLEDMPCPFDPNDKAKQYLPVANPYQDRQIRTAIDGLFSRAAALLEAQRPS
jgi:hypothetical protein